MPMCTHFIRVSALAPALISVVWGLEQAAAMISYMMPAETRNAIPADPRAPVAMSAIGQSPMVAPGPGPPAPCCPGPAPPAWPMLDEGDCGGGVVSFHRTHTPSPTTAILPSCSLFIGVPAGGCRVTCAQDRGAGSAPTRPDHCRTGHRFRCASEAGSRPPRRPSCDGWDGAA